MYKAHIEGNIQATCTLFETLLPSLWHAKAASGYSHPLCGPFQVLQLGSNGITGMSGLSGVLSARLWRGKADPRQELTLWVIWEAKRFMK